MLSKSKGKESVASVDLEEEEDPWAGLPKHLKNKKKIVYIRNHSDLKTCSKYSKFLLLFWKDFVNLKRRWYATLLELLTPIVAVAILVIFVSLNTAKVQHRHEYKSFGVNSPIHTFKRCSRFVFAPSSGIVGEIMGGVKEELASTYNFEMMKDEETLEKGRRSDLCAAVIFNFNKEEDVADMDSFSQHINFTIRMSAVHQPTSTKFLDAGVFLSRGSQWHTDNLYPDRLITGPRNEEDETGGSPGYFHEGFLFLQHLISEKIIHKIYIDGHSRYGNGSEDAEHHYDKRMESIFLQLNRFPYPQYKDNDVVVLIQDTLPLTIVVAYLVPFMFMVYGCVKEKESGMRLQMKAVGIPISHHRYCWILRCLFLHIPGVGVITAILATNWSKSKNTGILTFTDPFPFFLLMSAFVFKTISLSMLLIVFFRKASTATAACGFLWIASYIPYYYVKSRYNAFQLWKTFLSCLLENTGIALGLHIVSDGEARGVGLTWDNLFNLEDLTVGWIVVITILSGFLDVLVSTYISRIFPDRGLVPLPWNFCFKAWYWNNSVPKEETLNLPSYVTDSLSLEERFPANFEKDSSDIRRRKELQMEKVTKYYGLERALNKFNLNCYEGHVTAIIGELGAGKSTLLYLVAGMTPFSGGSIVVSRHDLLKQRKHATSFVGYCPEENWLYPHLSVEEMLSMFCQLKCTGSRLIRWDEVNRFVKDAMLEEYRHSRISELTTSAKRILMVACAFIGGSRVVLLDEPTKNMNAAQKRMTWELISKQKRHRTILVAMNCMNEGDTVVDKLVCLQHGEAHCAGTIRFMQEKFGGGYHLFIEKKKNKDSNYPDVSMIRDLITRRLGDILPEKESETQIDFFLPDEKTGNFRVLLEDLERQSGKLGLETFYISYRTLDEVLMNVRRIAMETDYDPQNRKVIYKGIEETQVDSEYKPLSGFFYHFHCFELLFLKNLRFTFRRKKTFILSSVAPILCVTCYLLILLLHPFDEDPGQLVIDLTPYQKPEVVVNCMKAAGEGILLCDELKETLQKRHPNSKLTVLYKETVSDYILRHYGKVGLDSLMAGIEIKKHPHLTRHVEMVGFFNNQPLHLPPVIMAILDNTILDYMVNYLSSLYPMYQKENNFSHHTITVTNKPLPYTPADRIKFVEIFISPGFFLGLVVSLGFAFFISSFVVLEVQERNFKHLQMLSGASSLSFWAANYIFNFLHFTIVSLIISAIVYGFHNTRDLEGFELWELLLFFVLLESYGITSVFFVGVWSLLPVSHWGLAYSRIFLFCIFTGPLFMFFIISMSDPNTKAPLEFVASFHNIFLCFPSYSLGMGIFYIMANAAHLRECDKVEQFKVKGACDAPRQTAKHPWNEFERRAGQEALYSCCVNRRSNSFDLIAYGIGRNLMCLLLILIGSLVIRILKESHFWTTYKKLVAKYEMRSWRERFPTEGFEHEIYDYDVLSEILHVENEKKGAQDLVIRKLTKELPGVKKVDELCLKIDRGECFCLLGVAGAGKSATLRMLVGARMPTSGDVTIDGHSLMKDYKNYIHNCGYCPYDSPFLKEMTGQEVVKLIGTLRRIPGEELDKMIANLSIRLYFLHDLDNQIKSYNNNSIRKLSAAVSMIGDPLVVVLDEPTDSMDLISRDYLLKNVQNLTNKGSIVILSSRSIAECEQVCSKMAIMVNGKLRCFGSPEHLRKQFAEGFTVIVKFVLDSKKIYFTTKEDMYRVHEVKKKDEEVIEEAPTKRYMIEDSERLSFGDITLYAERSGVSAAVQIEEEEHNLLLTSWEDDLLDFIEYFERYFPDSILVDKQPGFIHYHIRKGTASSAELFDILEQAKVMVSHIETYYIGQANLDQVFINFARGQKPSE